MFIKMKCYINLVTQLPGSVVVLPLIAAWFENPYIASRNILTYYINILIWYYFCDEIILKKKRKSNCILPQQVLEKHD